jgi:hypothetical protein
VASHPAALGQEGEGIEQEAREERKGTNPSAFIRTTHGRIRCFGVFFSFFPSFLFKAKPPSGRERQSLVTAHFRGSSRLSRLKRSGF